MIIFVFTEMLFSPTKIITHFNRLFVAALIKISNMKNDDKVRAQTVAACDN